MIDDDRNGARGGGMDGKDADARGSRSDGGGSSGAGGAGGARSDGDEGNGRDDASEAARDGTGGGRDDGSKASDHGGNGKGDDRGAGGGSGGDDQGGGGKGDGSSDGKSKGDDGHSPPPKAKWPWVVGGVVILVFVVAVLIILLTPGGTEKTNDAYVQVHFTTLAPRVSGQVVAVTVLDNQPVRAGQVLVQIDPVPYRAALQRALAVLEQDRAKVLQAEAQLRRQPAVVGIADAQVEDAEAAMVLSRPNEARYAHLAETGGGSEQLHQQTLSQLRQDQAKRHQALATRAAAVRQVDALRADLAAARAQVASDEAEVAVARLNLGYTRIVSPIDGTVDQRAVQVGNYVAPGAALMTVVPLNAVYIEANYRELALRHMAPGQHVSIHVDAYDIYLDGFVESLPPSSGAAYSPIPPNNATGNFTKIVQRLPVHILVHPGQPLARLLRVGMSVETWVDTGLADVVGAQAASRGRIGSPYPNRPVPAPGPRP